MTRSLNNLAVASLAFCMLGMITVTAAQDKGSKTRFRSFERRTTAKTLPAAREARSTSTRSKLVKKQASKRTGSALAGSSLSRSQYGQKQSVYVKELPIQTPQRFQKRRSASAGNAARRHPSQGNTKVSKLVNKDLNEYRKRTDRDRDKKSVPASAGGRSTPADPNALIYAALIESQREVKRDLEYLRRRKKAIQEEALRSKAQVQRVAEEATRERAREARHAAKEAVEEVKHAIDEATKEAKHALKEAREEAAAAAKAAADTAQQAAEEAAEQGEEKVEQVKDAAKSASQAANELFNAIISNIDG